MCDCMFEGQKSIEEVLRPVKEALLKKQREFLSERIMLGPEKHHELCQKRQRESDLEMSRHFILEKIGALGLSPELRQKVTEELMAKYQH